MQETEEMWVWSLGWEDSLEKGMATHSSILAWRTAMDRGAWQAIVHRVAKSSTGLKTLSLHIGLKLSMPLRDFWEFPQYEGMVISAPGCLPLQNSYSPYIRAFHCFLPLYWTSNGTHPFSLTQKKGSPGGSVIKNLPANAGDTGSIPGLGRFPGEWHGNPLQYSCLENSKDRGVWWAI